jgi:hypothetical protein
VELRVKTSGQHFTIHHNPTGGIYLEEGFGFETSSIRDYIVFRAWATNVVEEFKRGKVPAV